MYRSRNTWRRTVQVECRLSRKTRTPPETNFGRLGAMGRRDNGDNMCTIYAYDSDTACYYMGYRIVHLFLGAKSSPGDLS